MGEPKELSIARDHLAKAEGTVETKDGLHHLQEGFYLLERVIEDPAAGEYRRIAKNLGATYTSKLYQQIKRHIDSHVNIPEPDLEHFFDVIRSFDDTCFELPSDARRLKIEVVKRLINLYYEGYPIAEKKKVCEQLAQTVRAKRRGG